MSNLTFPIVLFIVAVISFFASAPLLAIACVGWGVSRLEVASVKHKELGRGW